MISRPLFWRAILRKDYFYFRYFKYILMIILLHFLRETYYLLSLFSDLYKQMHSLWIHGYVYKLISLMSSSLAGKKTSMFQT